MFHDFNSLRYGDCLFQYYASTQIETGQDRSMSKYNYGTHCRFEDV